MTIQNCRLTLHMRTWQLLSVTAFASFLTTSVYAGDIRRVLAAEVDPVAPIAAMTLSKDETRVNMWAAQVDFNVGRVATGPEFWVGNFAKSGPDDTSTYVRPEDLQPGESHKLEASRFRWTISLWEKPSSMRGWFIKSGYSYTSIQSRAHRETSTRLDGPSVPLDANIVDTRHGLMAGFGQRWAIADSSATITLAISSTFNFKRSLAVDSEDPDAQADYKDFTENMPYARMSTKSVPEAALTLGWLI